MPNSGMIVDTGKVLLGPRVERCRLVPKIVNVEDRFRVRQVEMGKVVKNSRSW